MPMLVIIPTRGRPRALLDVLAAWRDTVAKPLTTELLFVVDHDDPEISNYYQTAEDARAVDLIQTYHDGGGMVAALNHAAVSAARDSDYDVIGFMGDDHRPRTVGWDQHIRGALAARPGVAYGNDLIQGPNLPTAAFITAKLITRLGYMAPPGLKHLYVDNFWNDLGEATNLTYLNGVVIEHMHPIAGKAAWDDRYADVNSDERYRDDQAAYKAFIAEQWPIDRAKLEG